MRGWIDVLRHDSTTDGPSQLILPVREIVPVGRNLGDGDITGRFGLEPFGMLMHLADGGCLSLRPDGWYGRLRGESGGFKSLDGAAAAA